jgi:hypothetical protein
MLVAVVPVAMTYEKFPIRYCPAWQMNVPITPSTPLAFTVPAPPIYSPIVWPITVESLGVTSFQN